MRGGGRYAALVSRDAELAAAGPGDGQAPALAEAS